MTDQGNSNTIYVARWYKKGRPQDADQAQFYSFLEAKQHLCKGVNKAVRQAYAAGKLDLWRDWCWTRDTVYTYATDAPFTTFAPHGYVCDITIAGTKDVLDDQDVNVLLDPDDVFLGSS